MAAYNNMTTIFNLRENKTVFNEFLSDGSDGDGDDGNSFLMQSICRGNESRRTELYRFITNGILLNLIGFLGILGNIISMFILSRLQMRSSINYILISLVRVDTILIITSILLFGIPGFFPYITFMFTYSYHIYPLITPVLYPLASAVQTASVYLTLLVSVDRFVAVCHPLRARSLCTYGRARIYVICVFIFSILYNIPRLWEANVMSEWDENFNTTIFCVRGTEFRYNKTYLKVYIHWCYFIFLYFIPFLSLAVLNVAIYNDVRKANKERARLSRFQHRKTGLETMLICVVVVFFTCNLLPMIINILESFDIDIDADIFDRMIKTSNLLVTINSSLNFIINVIFGKKFKRLFLVLFCSYSWSCRDSPGAETHDGNYMPNEECTRLRLHRYGTSLGRNGVDMIRMNCRFVRDSNTRGIRASSPGLCMYYLSRNTAAHPPGAFTTQSSPGHANCRRDMVGYDWSISDQHWSGPQDHTKLTHTF